MSYHPIGSCCAACARKPGALGGGLDIAIDPKRAQAEELAAAIKRAAASAAQRAAAAHAQLAALNLQATAVIDPNVGRASRWPLFAAAGIAALGVGAFLYLRKKH